MPNLSLAAYQAAEREAAHADARRGFLFHLSITVAVVLGLVALNVFVASEFPWSVFPAIGMTIGLLAHWTFGVRHVDTTVREHQQNIERSAA